MTNSFDRFAVGDVIVLECCFSRDDYVAFSRLSGESNSLHHDKTGELQIIVPLYLVLSPLSRIAGLLFSGGAAVYLSHEVRAAQAVHYGQALRYSVRIEAVNIADRILTLRSLALRGTEVVLDAAMQIQVAESWSSESAVPVLHTGVPGRAMVTGASGAIGRAVTLALASRGWTLVLQDRGDGPHREFLRATLDRLNVDAEFIAADLATETGCAVLAAAVSGRDDMEAIVHAASPGPNAPLEQLVAANYAALKRLTAVVLPTMLTRQKGRVLMIGSATMARAIPGWEDYAAAKSMATGFVAGLENQFSAYGVRGLVVMPDYVAGSPSEAVRNNAPILLAEEVASVVAEMIEAPQASAVLMRVGRRIDGAFGFSSTQTTNATPPSPAPSAALSDRPSKSAAVADIVRRVLRLPQSTDLSGGGIGVTPRWDSLTQIEVILALEADLKIQFSSSELTELGNFEALAAVCQRKVENS